MDMNRKATLTWQGKAVKTEVVTLETLFKMFPELETFVDHFDPLNFHITYRNADMLTINFHRGKRTDIDAIRAAFISGANWEYVHNRVGVKWDSEETTKQAAKRYPE